MLFFRSYALFSVAPISSAIRWNFVAIAVLYLACKAV